MREQDRFRGCLVGGAAGDALGYTVEFMREREIFSRYGEQGITEYVLENGTARISDDTQMTLFTATGLLQATTRCMLQGVMGSYSGFVYRHYLDWLRTQEKRYPLPAGPYDSWLVNVPELFSSRAPGNTCLSALHSGKRGTIEKPLNESKGCGGVMRAAPVGLYFSGREIAAGDIQRIGAETAAITHGHELGWLPAAALAQIVHEVSGKDESVRNAVLHTLGTVTETWPETEHRAYFVDLVRKAVELAEGDTGDLEAIHRLGEGWVAEETLAIAVFCAVRYAGDFDRAIIAAVNHNGDSDSTGAVTGNILGAKLGLAGIPEKYTKDLELKGVILEVADDLWHDCRMSGYGEYRDPKWIRKYMGRDARND